MSEKRVPFSVYAEVNPPASSLRGQVTVGTQVSFVPMADVSESGRWTKRQIRCWEQVNVGFTAFGENDVIFAKITPCMENGKGALMKGLSNGRGYGSTEFHVLRAKDENSPEFVYQWCQSAMLRQSAEAWMSGSAGQQRVESSFFRRFEIPEISPDQQRRIASVLRTVDEVIEWTEKRLEKQQAIKQGLLHDLFTRGLTPEGKLRPSPTDRPDLYQDSPLGPIPKEWEVEPLGTACKWHSGGTPSRAITDWWDGDYPWLTPKDMKVFDIPDTSEHVTEEAARSGSRIVPARAVFIVVRGMILAHTFPVCISDRPFAFNQDIKAITSDKVDGRFLAHWFSARSRLFLSKTTEATHGTKRFDLKDILRVEIGIPSVDEQRRIVERIDEADRSRLSTTATLTKLRHLKSALMQDLLTGRVSATAIDLEGS